MKALLYPLLCGIILILAVQGLRGITTQPLTPDSYQPIAAPSTYIHKALHLGAQGALLLSLSLTILSIALVYLLFRRLELDAEHNLLATTLYAISPLYLYSAYVADGTALVIVLQLLGLILMTYKKPAPLLLAGSLFLVSAYQNPWHLVISLGLITIFYIETKNNNYIWQGFFVVIAGIIIQLQKFITWYTLQHIDIRPYTSIISDLGGAPGISIFTFSLGIFGLTYLERKWTIAALLLYTIAYLDYTTIWCLGILLSYSASIAIYALYHSKWTQKDLKNITLLLIACGLVFSPLSFAREMETYGPTPSTFDVMTQIKQRTPQGSVIFSAPANGNYIAALGKREPVLASKFDAKDAILRLNMTEDVLTSYNLPEVLDSLRLYNVSHILVSPDMIGTVWDEPNTGLHYLLQNEEHFKRVYTEGGYTLYEVVY